LGNGAYRQRQHDVWGALLDSIYLHTKSRDELPEDVWPCSSARSRRRSTAGAIPTAGSGRSRRAQHFVSSKVFCWVAWTAARGSRGCARTDERRALAGRRRRDPRRGLREGRRPRGVFVQHYETEALDASCLLLPLLRFLPPDDERIVATVNAIAEELSIDGLVLRYRSTRPTTGSAARRARSRSARSGW
jgi:GH15 family glucan-1,4-alpha-glucosidase